MALDDFVKIPGLSLLTTEPLNKLPKVRLCKMGRNLSHTVVVKTKATKLCKTLRP